MRKLSTTWSCAAGATLLLSVSGCDRVVKLLAERLQPTSVSGAPSQAPSVATLEEEKDDQLSTKLSKYIECLNRVTSNVSNSRERYLSWADEQKGISGTETRVLGLQDIYSADGCSKAIAEAKKLTPPLPEIEATAVEYESALAALVKHVNPAVDYYKQADYEDDQFAKGKAMHAPLLGAFDAFRARSELFDRQVTRMNDEVALRRLARLEKNAARRFEYLNRKVLQEAKALIKFAEVQELAMLSFEAYSAQLMAYDDAISALERYAEQHKDEVAKTFGFSSVLTDMKDFLKAAKELQRRKRDNKDFGKERPPAGQFRLIEGHPAQLIEKYNELIASSNNFRM